MTTPAPSFTPGPRFNVPFNIERTTREGTVIVDADNDDIAVVHWTSYHDEKMRTKGKNNLALFVASPSLYAYAKAEHLLDVWYSYAHPETSWSDLTNHFRSMGWDGTESKRVFLHTYRAAALAQAEGK